MEEIKYDNKNLYFLHGGREVDTKVRVNDIADKDDKETNKLNIWPKYTNIITKFKKIKNSDLSRMWWKCINLFQRL